MGNEGCDWLKQRNTTDLSISIELGDRSREERTNIDDV